MDANKLIASFEQWGIDRRIVLNSTPKAQFLKTVEEVGELASALAKNDKPAMVDAIGDIVVTLAIVASCSGVPLVECMRAAWEQIKDRKGTLTPEGVFVKERAE
jgi:NTP pyrophosphatase (non-canonical NTP hydrolase)